MGFWQIWSLARGYVVIVVEGKQIEKFINMAVSRGYNLWDIFQPRDNVMIAKVSMSVYPSLRHVARACRCKMRISKKKGLPFAAVKMRNRKMLVAGALVFFASLYILSSFIWFVEVTSSKELKMITKEQILKAASENGVRRGALRYKIDSSQVSEALEKKFIEISWIGIEVRGTKVVIDVVEKVMPKEDEHKGLPGNVVAVKDGVIKELLVLSGEPKVAAGDTVKKGDILISGVIFPDAASEENGESQGGESEKQKESKPVKPIYLSARGVVRARVWYESKVKIPLVQLKEELTGEKQRVVMLRLGGKEIVLKNEAGNQTFKYYRTTQDRKKMVIKNYSLPVEVSTTTYHQIEKRDVYLNMAEARDAAEKSATKDISLKLPEGAEIVSKRTEVSASNERELKAVVYIETLENIAQFVPIR